MKSYTPIFEEAQDISKSVDYRETFSTFHDHPELYHFIMAPVYQSDSDMGALIQAEKMSPVIYESLYAKGPSLIGNGSSKIDGVESRHILVLTYLISTLGTNWGDVVEIGGGYGNYPRLVQGLVDYNTWSIIDLDYICELQNWFFDTLDIDRSNITTIANTDYEAQNKLNPLLVIGVHSLSEISLENFNKYIPLIFKSKWFYYVSQRSNPSTELLQTKLNIIFKTFNVFNVMEYEGGSSIAYIFKNKEYL